MIRSALLSLTLVILMVSAFPAHAREAAGVAGAATTLVDDGVALAVSPLDWQPPEWLTLAGVGLSTVVLYQYDATINASVRHRRGPVATVVSETANTFGDWRVLLPALGATAWVAKQQDNPYLEGTAGRSAEAAMLAYLGAGAIKVTVDRARPEAGRGSHAFDGPGIRGDTHMSFPSGHTAAAFAVASVISRRYPQLAYGAYGDAALTGYARVAKQRHWATDVWGGAALGLWIGHSLMNRHPRDRSTVSPLPKVSMAPTANGIKLVLTWKQP